MVQASTIEIQDVNAITEVQIPIAPGTIVLLVGDNGSGKSTAINAVTSSISGENIGLKPRDGKKAGKIRLPGATISVGGRLKKTATGEAVQSFVVVEDGAGIKKILNPGIKDVQAADRKRLEGVLDVIGAELNIASQKEFLGDYYAGFATSRKDAVGFVETVKQMKLYLESVARDYGQQVSQADGAIAEIGDVAPVGDVKVLESPESLHGKIESLAVEVRDAKRDREVADGAVRSLEALYGGLTIEQMDANIAVAESRVESVVTEMQLLVNEIETLQQKLEELQGDLSGSQGRHRKHQDAHAALVKSRNDRVALTEAVGKAMSAEDIAAKDAELAALRGKYDSALLSTTENKSREQKRERLAALKHKREFAESGEVKMRAMVKSLPTLFVKAMESIPGWVVDEDMRLCVEHKRGVIPFSELSPGEGTAKVCLLACQFASYADGEIPVVGLPQECYEGLDGTNKKLLLDQVREQGLCLVTGRASDEHINGISVTVL